MSITKSLLRAGILMAAPALVGIGRAEGEIAPIDKYHYPQAVIDRPLTLPRGMLELRTAFAFTSLDFFSLRLDDWDMIASGGYGITDRLQLDIATVFSLHRNDASRGYDHTVYQPTTSASWNHTLSVRLSYQAFDGEALDIAPNLTVPFQSDGGGLTKIPAIPRMLTPIDLGNPVSSTNDNVVEALGIEVPFRYLLGRRLWMEGGRSLVTISTNDPVDAEFAFVTGLGLQATQALSLLAETQIANVFVPVDDSEAHATPTSNLADFVPLRFTGVFAPRSWLDFTAVLSLPDAGEGFANYRVMGGIRIRL